MVPFFILAPQERQKYEILLTHEFPFDKTSDYTSAKSTNGKRA